MALWQRWKLRLGDNSKHIIDCTKPWIDLTISQPEFLPVLKMNVLGCIVSGNGSPELDFVDCKSKMWRMFYANFGGAMLMCNVLDRMKWLSVNILAVAAARWVSWPFSHSMAGRLDKTQCHMVELLLNYPRKNNVSNEMYYRNRSILAGRTCASLGRWSIRWATAVLKWHSHCLRGSDVNMWHKYILSCRTASWLDEQRLLHGRGIIKRTKTRLFAGKVSVRWSESIDYALEVSPAWSAVVSEHDLNIFRMHAASISRI